MKDKAREVQTGTVDGNRDITDTYYNTDGWTSETTNPYYNANPVGTTLVQTKTPPETQAQPGDVPAETRKALAETVPLLAFPESHPAWPGRSWPQTWGL